MLSKSPGEFFIVFLHCPSQSSKPEPLLKLTKVGSTQIYWAIYWCYPQTLCTVHHKSILRILTFYCIIANNGSMCSLRLESSWEQQILATEMILATNFEHSRNPVVLSQSKTLTKMERSHELTQATLTSSSSSSSKRFLSRRLFSSIVLPVWW